MARYLLLLAAACGFLISALAGCWLVPFLHKLKFGQTIRESGPTWHNKKNGTPNMGGFCFILGSTLALGIAVAAGTLGGVQLLGNAQSRSILLCMLLAFGSGFIGFLDDFTKDVRKQNLGLKASQKIVLQVLVTAAYMVGMQLNGTLPTQISLPGGGCLDLGLAFYPIAFLGIIFMVNAVNLTDGLDGLCTSVTFVVMLGYVCVGGLLGYQLLSTYAAAMAGACAGFLLWNFYPAKTFMGDTGSMFLGGIVTSMAFALCRPELILLMGIVYIWDAMTVVIQRVYFKATHGKRIFKMTPIHHSFEMSGWSEVKIDGFFSLIALIGVALALLFLRVS